MLIRPLTTEDKPLIEQWIAGEPQHADNTFEFYSDPKARTVIYEQEAGPVFAVRYSSALRVDIEFNPEASREDIRATFQEGFPDVVRQAREQGFSELIFESESPKLIAFCETLGYEKSPSYRKVL